MSAPKSLQAVARDRVGKGAARAVRREGRVPAVIYGAGQPPQAISLDADGTRHLILGGKFLTTVFDIDVGGSKVQAIPRDFQLDPVKDTPLHVDFLRVAKGQTIAVEVPVHFVNHEDSRGLKEGGTLNVVSHHVGLNVSPDSIPAALEVDLKGLEVGDTIHISNVKLPAGSTLTVTDRDFTVATIAAPTVLTAEEEAPTVEAAPAPAAEPEADPEKE
jgi:large subunit ribosomal protein L25